MNNRRISSASALLFCLAFAAPAAAQDRPPDRTPQAEAMAAFDAGDFRRAAELWEKMLALAGPAVGWRANYNLGLCYQNLGEATLAVERFEAFIAGVKAQPETPENMAVLADDARSRIDAIRASHAAVELPPAAGVKVKIDDDQPREVGFTAYLAPGHHAIVIVGPDGAERQQELDLGAGRKVAIDTRAPESPKPPPAPPPERVRVIDESPSFPTVWVLVGAGLTAVSFVFPGVMYANADSARDDAEALGRGHTGYADARDGFESDAAAYELSYLLPAGLGAITAVVAVVGAVRIATWTPAEGDTAVGLSFRRGGAEVWLDAPF